jgi:UDP-N-acetylglucosamine 2-epimerase (non-hydrolysing)
MRIVVVVGARPNFMKAAPLVESLRSRGYAPILVHTGQHYDENMSRVFFRDLGLPAPDVDLGIGSGSHAEQTARIMVAFEKVALEKRPDLVVVVGDVNSTMACALVSAKLWIPVAHVEAGLRSGDRAMPEEINRLVTDCISDLLLTPSVDADENLAREGVSPEKIHRVGNIMIDSLVRSLPRARESDILDRLSLRPGEYGVLTLHRPSNVDDPEALLGIMGAVHRVGERLKIVFSCHPRTLERLDRVTGHGDQAPDTRVLRVPPLGYLDFLRLVSSSRLVLTDSGGLQEESTFLRIPCVTIRENTERPITVSQGSNVLAGSDPGRIERCALQALENVGARPPVPDLWDGQTAPRIVDVLERWWAGRTGRAT